jgi:hypothetical protein
MQMKLDEDLDNLKEERSRQTRLAATVTDEMYKDSQVSFTKCCLLGCIRTNIQPVPITKYVYYQSIQIGDHPKFQHMPFLRPCRVLLE